MLNSVTNFFEIIKAECWNFGMTAMMRSEKNAD